MASAAETRQTPSSADISERFDVLIVGAGLSGIDAGYRVSTECPGKSYAILEARDAIGGTWDLFRYPGIRSDSDMYTLGFPFHPWPSDRAIADGEAIRDYIVDTAQKFGIDRHIRFGCKVVAARWSTQNAEWVLEIEENGEKRHVACSFLYMGSGYYDYAGGHTPHFEGAESFGGEIVHPQQWPEDLDYADKRVVVIGSGATAVTLVPAMARTAAKVTMLQRSPTYIVARPSEDAISRWTHEHLPKALADGITKWKSVGLGIATYGYARRKPAKVKAAILDGVREQLPEGYPVERDFEPSYNPWDQRICLVPDADLFDTIRNGDAEIVTDTIERFTPEGIALTSGRELPADIIVTATGLTLTMVGGVELYVDGDRVDPADRLVYKGMMLEGVPNMALAFGYTNASWTLKCDLSARHACRLINYLDAHDKVACLPRRAHAGIEPEPMLDFSSGYVQRAANVLPKQGSEAPWKVHQNYALDLASHKLSPVADGTMHFIEAGQALEDAVAPTSNRKPVAVAAASGIGASAAALIARRGVKRSASSGGAGAALALAARIGGGAALAGLVGGAALVGFAALSRSRAQAAVPADGRFVRVNGKRVHYRDVGSGPTIVMIHGLAGQMRNFSYALLDKLASDHRVILIDRPGSGYSDPIDSATIRSQAAHIGDALQTLGLDRPLVVGHSLGGAVALALALDRPDQVGGLALLAPLTHPMDEVSEAFDGLAIASPTARLAVAWTLATPMMMLRGEKGAQAAFAPEPVPGDFATRGGGALLARPGNFQAASADLNAAPADLPGMVARYPSLEMPVSVLFGRDDPVLDPEAQGEAFVAAVPRADLTLIEGGHMIPVTQPDTVADWIRERALDFPSDRPE